MKTFTLRTLRLLFIIAAIATADLSCTKPAPAACTLDCKYGGTCSHDSCICPLGYTGRLCEEPNSTSVTYVNGSAMSVWLTLNGKKDTINTGDSLEIKGVYGSPLTATGYTYGLYPGGQRLGLNVTLNDLSCIFPPSGSAIREIQVPPNVFFLKVKVMHPSLGVSAVTVNAGSPIESTYSVDIPNDGKEYQVGYFTVLQPCVIYLFSKPTGYRWTMKPTIAGSYNLSTTLIVK